MTGEGEQKVAKGAPFLWAGFFIGGFIAAFFMPFLIVYILLSSLGLFPSYLPDFLAWDHLQAWLANPLARLFVAIVFIATIYHAFHRLKYVLYDYGGHKHPAATAAFTYGVVVIAALATLYVVLPVGIP